MWAQSLGEADVSSSLHHTRFCEVPLGDFAHSL